MTKAKKIEEVKEIDAPVETPVEEAKEGRPEGYLSSRARRALRR